MTKKLACLCVILSSFSALAKGSEGLFIRYNIEREANSQPVRGVADYYYQGRDFLAVVNFGENMSGEMIFLETGGRRYSLFPKEKTYVETKEFAAGPTVFHPQTEGEFTSTGIKKKILGYKCEIFKKESKDIVTNVCLSAKLHKNWGVMAAKMENVGQDPTSIASKGFPLEIVTLEKSSNKQTVVTMVAIRQKDYKKKFEILNDYKKKEGPDVQKNSTKMIQSMPTTDPMNQQQLNQMEKMTEEMSKKYKPEN